MLCNYLHKTRVHCIVSLFSAGESVVVNCKVAAVYLAAGAVYSKVYLAGGAGEVPSLETEAWTQIVNTSHPNKHLTYTQHTRQYCEQKTVNT